MPPTTIGPNDSAALPATSTAVDFGPDAREEDGFLVLSGGAKLKPEDVERAAEEAQVAPRDLVSMLKHFEGLESGHEYGFGVALKNPARALKVAMGACQEAGLPADAAVAVFAQAKANNGGTIAAEEKDLARLCRAAAEQKVQATTAGEAARAPDVDQVDTTQPPTAHQQPIESEGTPTPVPPEESTGPTQKASLQQKVFNFLGKLFHNPRFQKAQLAAGTLAFGGGMPIFDGASAIGASLPILGQVVSGVAAVVGFLIVLEKFASNPTLLTQPKQWPWLEMMSTAAFLGGAFVPGLGAFGGLVALIGSREKPQDPAGVSPDGTADTPSAPLPEELPPMPLSQDDFAAALETATTKDALAEETAAEQWLQALAQLGNERKLLESSGPTAGEEDEAVAERRAELAKFFEQTLPGQISDYCTALHTEASLDDSGKVTPEMMRKRNVLTTAEQYLQDVDSDAAAQAREAMAEIKAMAMAPMAMEETHGKTPVEAEKIAEEPSTPAG